MIRIHATDSLGTGFGALQIWYGATQHCFDQNRQKTWQVLVGIGNTNTGLAQTHFAVSGLSDVPLVVFVCEQLWLSPKVTKPCSSSRSVKSLGSM